MKLFKKENLYIRTTQETEEPNSKRNWLPYIGSGIFILLVILSLFFVEGTLLPSGDDKEYKTSQKVILPMVTISSLNPLVSKDEDTYYITKLIYEGLFALDETMTPKPELVDKFAINKETLSISLTLRQGVVWHDGKKFTANDVKYSVDAYKAAGDQSLYKNEIDKINRVKVNGNSKVVIYFNSADNMGLDLLTFPILPEHQFDSIGNAIEKISGFKPVGTGSYKYKNFGPTTHLTLVANKEYYGELAQNSLVFQVLPNKVNFFNLLKASNLSLIFSKAATRESEVSGEDVTVVDFPSNEVEYLGFNFAQADLSKKSVRNAIVTAINPQEIIDESYFGSGITNDDIYYPRYLGVDPMEEPTIFDSTKSDGYLKNAGYEDKNGDGYVENADGDPLTLRILVNENNTSRGLAAKEIVAFLKDIGIKATIDRVPWDAYLGQLKSGDFDLYLGGMKLSKDMNLQNLLAKNGENNYLGYGNGKMDDLLVQMRSGLTPSEMQQTFIEIRGILHEDLPYFCLLYKTIGAIQSPALIGELTPTFDDYYKGCETWYCRYEVTPQATEE